MKFEIYRISDYGRNKPCNGCYPVYDGERPTWYIEINTLEELIKLAKDLEEEIIISNICKTNKDDFELEIYDDYRE